MMNVNVTHLLYHQLIKNYYTTPDLTNTSQEDVEGIQFFMDNMGLYNFPYKFVEKYYNLNVKLYKDRSSNMYYTVTEDKKLYFAKNCTEEQCRTIFRMVALEQDYRSPHRYLTGSTKMIGTIDDEQPYIEPRFEINKNDIIMDIGVAEGNFTLSLIDTIGKAYLFESNPLWIEALEKTFYPYSSKVEIVPKYVSDLNNENEITIDSFLKDKSEVNFIKMDIEGAEESALIGAVNTLRFSRNLKLSICTYHKKHDAYSFEKYLTALGYSVEFTKGIMFFYQDLDLEPPYHRKGVLRASKVL